MIEPRIPSGRRGGGKRSVVMREMVNGHMHISLPAADGVLVIATLFGMFPFLEKLLEKLFADGGDQGAKFKKALALI